MKHQSVLPEQVPFQGQQFQETCADGDFLLPPVGNLHLHVMFIQLLIDSRRHPVEQVHTQFQSVMLKDSPCSRLPDEPTLQCRRLVGQLDGAVHHIRLQQTLVHMGEVVTSLMKAYGKVGQQPEAHRTDGEISLFHYF